MDLIIGAIIGVTCFILGGITVYVFLKVELGDEVTE